jgi:hypothetical protein
MNVKNLYDKIPKQCYEQYIQYIKIKYYSEWKSKMKLVNLEINIEDITAELDMYLDEPTYHIYVKKKYIDDDDEEVDEEEYVFYHEYYDCSITYNMYLKIAEARKLLY